MQWPNDAATLLASLQRNGGRAADIARLLALRLAWCDRDPALDGLDARTSFARWLCQQGRIGEWGRWAPGDAVCDAAGAGA